MMAISELSTDEWNSDLINKIEKIVSKSADELESILNTLNYDNPP